MTGTIGLHHIGISVSDIETSLRFYRDILGLKPLYDVYVKRSPDLEAVVGMANVETRTIMFSAGEQLYLELWQYDQPAGRALRANHCPADHGITHFALQFEDVAAIHQRIVDNGYRAHSKPKDLGMNTATYVRGPDNEIIEILEETETTLPTLEALIDRTRQRMDGRGQI